VHARGPGLDHQLRELHDGREAAVAGITVSHDRRQVIDVLPTGKRPAVVVLQSLEELVDLLRDRIIRIVREVGTGLVRRRTGGRALPAGDVDRC
jgi:hypothetical protein